MLTHHTFYGFIGKTVLGLLVFVLLLGTEASVEGATNNRLSMPPSQLGGSPDTPIFLGLYGQAGVAFDYDSGLPGGGLFVLFRPGASVNFLDFLYNWNSGLILQADYLPVSDKDQYLLSADIVFRKYFQDMRKPDAKGSTFVGLGFGASKAQLNAKSRDKYWSWLAEVGREWTVKQKYVFWVKGQYRHYSHGAINYSNMALQLGMGIPLPW